MKIYLFTFGKLKTAGLRETADYYHRLLRSWAPVEEYELRPESISQDKKSPAIRTQIQLKEGRILLTQIKKQLGDSPKGPVFLLDETGKAQSSEDWARQLKASMDQGVSTVSFCIGSSLGFSSEVRKFSNGALSLGPQTLSHELSRVVLLEQLYRAFSILKGHPYHNAGT